MKELKDLAAKFGLATSERTALLAQAEKLVAALETIHQATGKLYVAFMKRIAEKGVGFVAEEKARLNGLAASKSITPAKASDFKRRLSVLAVFAS